MSFLINQTDRSAQENQAERLQRAFITRLDRSNSASLIAQARRVYVQFLQQGGALASTPRGVILQGSGGRVVFSLPTLLPDELFVPGDWLLGQGTGSHRGLRSRSKSQPSWSSPKA